MKTFGFVLGTLAICGAAMGETAPLTASLKRSYPIGSESGGASGSARSADPNARYSNITTFLGTAVAHGGATVIGANTITRLLADDISMTKALPDVEAIAFSVANLNQVSVSARARLRFYQNDGAGGGPGTVIAGYSFPPIAFAPSTVGLFSFDPGALSLPKDFWAGITFDNSDGSTGATGAQLDNLGQGQFGPVDVGSSTLSAFLTTSGGSFNSSNPAGSIIGATAPIQNFGWQFVGPAQVVPLPGAAGAGLTGLVVLAGVRRRRGV